MNPCERYMQLIGKHIGERHRDAQAGESAGSRDTCDAFDIFGLKVSLGETSVEMIDQLMIGAAMINEQNTFRRVTIETSHRSLMGREI